MKYAVIEIGGKQVKVTEGATFKIERQKDVSNINVLMYSDGDKVLLGEPHLSDIEVELSVEGVEKAQKVRVARFRSKSRHRRVKGHRQPISLIKVESISTKGEKKKAEPKASTKEEKSVKSDKTEAKASNEKTTPAKEKKSTASKESTKKTAKSSKKESNK